MNPEAFRLNLFQERQSIVRINNKMLLGPRNAEIFILALDTLYLSTRWKFPVKILPTVRTDTRLMLTSPVELIKKRAYF